MRFFCLATLLATACAFTSQPAAFTTTNNLVGERVVDDNVVAPTSHRNRRATIVMDGKANGESYVEIVLESYAYVLLDHFTMTKMHD